MNFQRTEVLGWLFFGDGGGITQNNLLSDWVIVVLLQFVFLDILHICF
jgi:hypothetical protein